MKNTITGIALCLLMGSVQAQSSELIMSDSQGIIVVKDTASGLFTITHKESNKSFSNLNFVKRVYGYYQVLDGDNDMFFINEDWNKLYDAKDFLGLCGTVPHYTMSVKENGDNFEVYENETFYNPNNIAPGDNKHLIPKSKADKVVFINGGSEFNFTGNFGVGIGYTNPRMVILVKNGKYFTQDNPSEKYDSIDFSSYHHSLKTKNDGVYGILGQIEPKYNSISEFNYYLAKATLPNGKEIFIDIDGNEYFPKDKRKSKK